MKGNMEADDRGSGDQRDDNLQSRRELLKSAGGYATYVAPAMVVLLKGDPAFATHANWHIRFCNRFPNHPLCISP